MRPPAQVSQALTGRLPAHLPWATWTWPTAAIPVLIELPGTGSTGSALIQLQVFVACGDVPALGACTTQSCRQLARQLANFCSVPLNAVTFARRPRAPAGFVPVSGTVSRKFKPSRRGQVE